MYFLWFYTQSLKLYPDFVPHFHSGERQSESIRIGTFQSFSKSAENTSFFMRFRTGWILGCFLIVVFGCEKSRNSNSRNAVDNKLLQKGKAVYIANCAACHHSDPKQNGAIGPSVAYSSLELLQVRLLEGKYPAGYVPKRTTKIMVPLPHLSNDIQALHEFLNQ